MKINFEDKEYDFDLDELDTRQAMYIQRKFGMTLMDLEEALERVDPKGVIALYWLMKNQNGETVDPDKVNFKIVKFAMALRDAALAEREANPTKEPGETTDTPTSE